MILELQDVDKSSIHLLSKSVSCSHKFI